MLVSACHHAYTVALTRLLLLAVDRSSTSAAMACPVMLRLLFLVYRSARPALYVDRGNVCDVRWSCGSRVHSVRSVVQTTSHHMLILSG